MTLETIALSASSILDAVSQVQDELNTNITEYNQMVDVLEARDKEIEELKARVASHERLLDKQNMIIEKAMETKTQADSKIKLLQTQLKELQKLDPKRLDKVNRAQKTQLAETKATLKDVESKRKQLIAENKAYRNKLAEQGVQCFYVDPDTGNGLRFLNLRVADTNVDNGVVNSPVVEFIHKQKGITRQGFLDYNGKVKWASAANTTPTDQEDLMAKTEILKFCQTHKIKTMR